METIGQSDLQSFLSTSKKALNTSNSEVRKDPGHVVRSPSELATKVAELQFRNWDHVLMFRGQRGDYKNQAKATSLKPSLFRPRRGSTANPDPGLLDRRFRRLEGAERLLAEQYSFLGVERVKRHRILRWAILQHYEICDTPLLDVSQSLRIAASFATDGASDVAYLYVLGVPNLSGAVTASAEAGLQIIRLTSACPPHARRPHVQEGYLVGEYPELGEYRQKQLYAPYEIDLGRRLVAKFRFDPRTFWKGPAFPKAPKSVLYPSPKTDPLCAVAARIKRQIGAAPR